MTSLSACVVLKARHVFPNINSPFSPEVSEQPSSVSYRYCLVVILALYYIKNKNSLPFSEKPQFRDGKNDVDELPYFVWLNQMFLTRRT